MNKKKNIDIIFLLEGSNKGNKDIDHMLPFLYFLNKSKKIEFRAQGFIFDSDNVNFTTQDSRTELLSKIKNVKLIYLNRKKFLFFKSNFKLINIFNSILVKFINKFLEIKTSKINWKKEVDKNFLKSNNPLIFTLQINEKIIDIVSKLKKTNKKAKWIILPHGTTICDNKMVYNSHLDKIQIIDKNNQYDKIDYILKTSNRDLNDAISMGLKKHKGKVIGSPRFCSEWLKLKSNLKLDGKKIPINNKKIRILFLLPKEFINIFTEELIRTIDFLSSYREFEIKTVNYYYYPRLPKYVDSRSNLKKYLISNQYSTSELINWSQIVFHVGTGVIFESFMKEKVTVFPKYLTCNTLISAKYGAGINLNNRDDLRRLCNEAVESIDKLKKNYKKRNFHSNKNFLNEFVQTYKNSVSRKIDKAVLSSIKK
jgi:hypothetical protein